MAGEKKKKWYEHFVTITDDKPQSVAELPEKNKTAIPDNTLAAGSTSGASTETRDEFVLTDNFQAIYEAAEISVPSQGYSVYKLMELLESEDFRAMAPEVRKSAILAALKITNVKIQDILQDAAARDRALDLYEDLKVKALEEYEKKKNAENAKLEEEIEALIRKKTEHIETNRRTVEQAKIRLSEWQKIKHAEEKKIYDAVSLFVDDIPVTLSNLHSKE